MVLAEWMLLVRLATATPAGCSSDSGSSARALSDTPYSPEDCPDSKPEGRSSQQASLPSNAALEPAMSSDRRIGFGIVGSGAALIVAGASMLLCSKVAIDPAQQKFCAAAWPWIGGTGVVLGGVGFGVIAASPSYESVAWEPRLPGKAWTYSAQLAFDF